MNYWILFFVNIVGIISVLFFERKKTPEIISWILVITFIPIGGLILYLLIGETASMRMATRFGRKQLFDDAWHKHRVTKEVSRDSTDLIVPANAVPANTVSAPDKYRDIVEMFKRQDASSLTTDNSISVFTDGGDKFTKLYEDIEAARHSVHLLYFTFNPDKVGGMFVDLLAEKAAEGVEVRLLFDAIGNFPYTKSGFKKLIDAGGKVESFFPLINIFKVNYRNHRKVVVIDGRIAYTGGINVSKSYIGEHKKAKPWRDTHIRLTGSGVAAYQERFFLDWIHVSGEQFNFDDPGVFDAYFPSALPEDRGNIAAQTVSSGPDVEGEHIKYGYIKMINRARRSLYMQSPYFIPDESFMLALKLAVDSGIDVRIILPGIPDKPMVYMLTRSYTRDLLRIGVKVYLYNGFIHSKMFIMDDEVTSIGTANIDIRSFLLDFEINAFMYDKAFSRRCVEIFEQDITNSRELTLTQSEAESGILTRLFETFLKILAPLL